MSDTPRTDAHQDDARNVALDFTCQTPPPTGNCYVVPAEFARELERELNAVKAELQVVLGSDSLKTAAELARARQSEISRLKAEIEFQQRFLSKMRL